MLLRFWSHPTCFQFLDLDGKPTTPTRIDPEHDRTGWVVSPQGDVVAMAQTMQKRTNRLLLLNMSDLSVRREIALKHPATAMAFSPDGKTLALGGIDRQIQHLDVASGEFVGIPLLHETNLQWASYLGNNRHLMTSGEKGHMLLWDVKTGKRIGPAFEHHADLVSIAVRPDGKAILAGTTRRAAMSWRIAEPKQGSLAEIRLWVEAMTGMEMTEADAIVLLDADRLLERRARLNQ